MTELEYLRKENELLQEQIELYKQLLDTYKKLFERNQTDSPSIIWHDPWSTTPYPLNPTITCQEHGPIDNQTECIN